VERITKCEGIAREKSLLFSVGVSPHFRHFFAIFAVWRSAAAAAVTLRFF
jgi:hypothetical protein